MLLRLLLSSIYTSAYSYCCSWFTYFRSTRCRFRSLVLSALVEKCLGSNRAGTRQKTAEILLEIVDADSGAPIIDELITTGTTAKQPKIVLASVALMREIVRLYGCKTVDVKPVFKCMKSTLFSHADNNVRGETVQLAVEIFKWTGASVFDSLFKELKPVQVQELNDLFSQVSEKPKQTRFLRSQKPKELARADNDGADAGETVNNDEVEAEAEKAVEIDPRDLAEPVDVLSKVPKNFEEMMASTKWKERKDSLDELLKVLDTPKYVDGGSYHQLVSQLGKKVLDINILVCIAASNCIEKIAQGLGKAFHPYRGVVVSKLLERLKEKKANIIAALRDALDAISDAVALKDILEDVLEAVGNKNPNVRIESTLFLVRCLANSKASPAKAELKAISEAMVKIIDDATPEVREASMQCLGTLMKIGSEKVVTAYLEKVDPLKMTKIQEFYQSAEVKAATKGSTKSLSAVSSSKTAGASSSSRNISTADPLSRLGRKPAGSKSMPSLGAKKRPASAPSKSSLAPKQKEAKSSQPQIQPQFTDDQAASIADTVFSEELLKNLDDANWKIRLESIEKMFDEVKAKSAKDASEPLSAELCFRILKSKNVWKDSNFQVMNKMFEIFAFFSNADNVDSKSLLTPPAASVAIPVLADKIGDMKLRKPSFDCLCAFMEVCGINYVLKECFNGLSSQKSPKALSEYLKAYKDFLYEFGTDGLDIKALVDTVKVQIQNSNNLVRGACVSLLGVMRQFLGPDLRSLLSDINAAQLSTIDAEFEKLANAPPLKPLRAPNPAAYVVEAAASSSLDEIIPKLDLTAKIGSDAIQNLGDANWKNRKEALDSILEIVKSANKRIKPAFGDLATPLAARLSDSNKNIVMEALEILAIIAESMGSQFEKFSKQFMSGIVANLNDNKVQVRQSASKTLDSFLEVVNLDLMLTAFATSLAADMPNLRRDLLTWIHENSSKHPAKFEKCDMAALIPAVIVCLQDRSLEVRKVAQNVLGVVVSSCGYSVVSSRFADSKVPPTLISQLETFKDLAAAAKAVAVEPASKEEDSPVLNEPKTPASKKSKIVAKTPAASQPTVAEPAAPEFPILTNVVKAKEKRADQDRGMYKWTFDSPRKDLIDFLQTQMDSNFSADVVNLLFSKSHYKEKDYLIALNLLDETLINLHPEISKEEMQSRFVANSDLIFKYISIRLFDTNTTMLLKCLDVVDHLVTVLDETSTQLTEYEASAFLPHFINKTGDSKEAIRTKVRGTLKRFARVYPASKLFNQLINSLSSKNARTRAECLDELGYMIQRNGMSVCIPSKSLPLIASQISDRDSSVRNAAIQAIVHAHALIEEQVFKYLGKITEKDRALLDERIRRTKGAGSPMKKSTEPIPDRPSSSVPKVSSNLSSSSSIAATTSASGSNKQFSLDLDQLKLPQLSHAAQTNALPAAVEPLQFNAPTPSINRIRADIVPGSRHGSQDDYFLDLILTQITSGDVYQSIDGLKKLEKQLQSDAPGVKPQINQLVNAITLQIRLAFATPSITGYDSVTFMRLLKHLINVLVQIFTKPDLAMDLNKDTMHQMLTELISRLVDKSLQNMGDNGTQLTRAFNVLMLKVLDNCSKNYIFSVLVDLLDAGIAAINHVPGDELGYRTKFTELVMKCLWKLTKSLRETVRNGKIDLAAVFYDIHRFLITNPSSEWKRRANENLPLGDMPLRTVKTILHEIAEEKGAAVLEIMERVDIEEPKRSAVYQYLRQMSEGSSHASKNNSPEKVENAPRNLDAESTSMEPRGVVTTTPLSEEEISYAIEQIFSKISSKDETKQGLVELYTFQKENSQTKEQIEQKLSTFGVNFRLYISRSIEKIASERGEESPIKHPHQDSDVRYDVEDEAVEYKKRLQKLQQMYGYETTAATSNDSDLNNNNSNGESNTTIDGATSFRTAPNTPGAEKEQQDTGNNLPSVVALKERLERMKTSMASLKSQP